MDGGEKQKISRGYGGDHEKNCTKRGMRQMNYYILAIEAVVLVIIFTFMIIVPLCKNPVWWIHDYPKDIQEEYFKTHERIPAAPLSKPALVKKGFAVLLAIVILTLGVWLVGARTFKEGFVISYLLW